MHERFIAIFPNSKQNLNERGQNSPYALEPYHSLLEVVPRYLRIGLLNACSETIGDIKESVIAVVIRVSTVTKYLEPNLSKTDIESVDWEDLRNKILKSRKDFPGKQIILDCGRWIDLILEYKKMYPDDHIFDGVCIENEALRIKNVLRYLISKLSK